MIHQSNRWSPLDMLRRSAPLRSIAYLGSMVAILETAHNTLGETEWSQHFHQVAVPAVALATYAFARLRPEDVQAWNQAPDAADLKQLKQGLVVGTAAIGTTLAAAAAKGWVSAPQWGWEQSSVQTVAQSVAFLTIRNIMTVWQEEMVFRGYGFDTLREAIGQPAATAILSILFGFYHGVEPKLVFTMTLAGLMLTQLRLKHNSLWLPYGFHLGWNLLQIIIFGPAHDYPSLRPLQLHGPEAWIGRPGMPEPGWLATSAIAIILAFLLLRRQQHRQTA